MLYEVLQQYNRKNAVHVLKVYFSATLGDAKPSPTFRTKAIKIAKPPLMAGLRGLERSAITHPNSKGARIGKTSFATNLAAKLHSVRGTIKRILILAFYSSCRLIKFHTSCQDKYVFDRLPHAL
ncbi:hypothetical protein J6590_086047 [Homalodisca vitripennis]|nr:hypothetical protein J6590_086047 [Homalodisca vitripennis]